MKATVIAVTFAAILVASPVASRLAGDVPVRGTVPASESLLPGEIECVQSGGEPAPAGNASPFINAYLHFHADLRADALVVSLPGRGMTDAAEAVPASCTGGEDFVSRKQWPAVPLARASR